MSTVQHMVCPACAQMYGHEHIADCPWNGLGGGVSPQPGASETYRDAAIQKLLAELDGLPGTNTYTYE